MSVSAISSWEVATLVRRGRIVLDRATEQWVRQALALPGIAEAPVDARIALTAGQLTDEFPGDPADRLIYASAVALGAPLITRDRRITAFDPHRCVW